MERRTPWWADVKLLSQYVNTLPQLKFCVLILPYLCRCSPLIRSNKLRWCVQKRKKQLRVNHVRMQRGGGNGNKGLMGGGGVGVSRVCKSVPKMNTLKGDQRKGLQPRTTSNSWQSPQRQTTVSIIISTSFKPLMAILPFITDRGITALYAKKDMFVLVISSP